MKKAKRRVYYNLAIFGKEEVDAVNEALQNFMLVGGKRTHKFERKISNLFGKNHGIMVNSGSAANLISLELLNLPAGSEVITPATTFGTTVAPIHHKNLVPSYVDVELGTYQIDVSLIEEAITKKTKAMIIPSLMGNIPD